MSISGISTSFASLQAMAATGTAATRSATATTGTPAASGADTTQKVPAYVVTAAASLGMTTDEVMEALAAGSSLAELAEEQGVSRDDLVATLVADAPAEVAASGGVEAMVSTLVDQTGLGGPGGGMPPPRSSGILGESLTSTQQDTVDALAELLETDSTTLLDSLRHGTSLAELLTQAGVSTADLAGVLEEGLLIDTSA